jgi:hypothetical protein
MSRCPLATGASSDAARGPGKGLLAMALVLSLAPCAAGSTVRYVAPTGTDSGACNASNHPCRTLQYAASQASGGDEVRVATGEYTGVLDHAAPASYTPATVRQVLYLDKTVTVRGGFTTGNWTTPNPTTNATTVNAQGGGRCVFVAGTLDPALGNPQPVLDGLRFVGGNASGLRGYLDNDAGGGVFVWLAQATIRNCSFSGNTASASTKGSGGGLASYYAPLTLTGSTFEGNVASSANRGNGGGAFVFPGPPATTLSGNTFRSNTGGSAAAGGGGGGLYLTQLAATLASNTVEANTAASATNGSGFGGGIYADNSALTMQGNVIRDNRASADAPWGSGGGLYLVDGSLASTGDQITGNTADARTTGGSGRGGGLCAASQIVGQTAQLVVKNATVSSNRASAATTSNIGSAGGGLSLSNLDATFSGCTVENNVGSVGSLADGGGLYLVDAAVRFVGGVIRGNSAGATLGRGGGIYVGTPIQRPEVGLSLTDSLIESNTAGGTQAGEGGGVMVERYSPVLLLGNRIVGNVSSGTGGGVGLGADVVETNPTFTVTVPAVVLDNLIQGNRSTSVSLIDGGGGVYAAWGSAEWGGLTIALNRFVGNIAAGAASGGGRGVTLYWSPHSRLDSNVVCDHSGTEGGGAIVVSYSDYAVLEGNTVEDNGGGVSLDGSWIEFRRNFVAGNAWGISGHTGRSWSIINNIVESNDNWGINFYGNVKPFPYAPDLITSGLIAHNTIANNRGYAGVYIHLTQGPVVGLSSGASKGATQIGVPTGAFWNVGDTISLIAAGTDWITQGWEAHAIAQIKAGVGLVLDAPLQHDYGAGSLVSGTRLVLVNNVITGNPIGVAAIESDLLVTGVNWFNNGSDVYNTETLQGVTSHYLVGVTSPTTGDPRFADPATGNFHIGAGSAAIDKGVPSSVTVDFDNQPRPAGAAPDLGADECGGTCAPVRSVAIGGPATATVGTPVTLTATTAPADASAVVDLRWVPEPTVGQGTASATYTFAATGSPVVTAVARNCGAAVSSSRSIGVGACGLACAASVPATALPGRSVTFSATATASGCSDAVAYRWSFGDDSDEAAGATATHAYAAAGSYRWTLTATSGAVACLQSGEIGAAPRTAPLRRVLPAHR